MTAKEIEMAKYIKDNILPKLQEMQRDLYFDQHVTMSVTLCDPYFGVDVWINVKNDREESCSDSLAMECFSFRIYERKEYNDDTLGDLRGMIKEWQETLA